MTMNGTHLARLATAFVAAAALAAGGPAAASPYTYIALGDSAAFGETDFTQSPSDGDRGYVGIYADDLAARNGGVRPNVINLAVDGETSATFFDPVNNQGAVRQAWRNTNYPSDPAASQSVSQAGLLAGAIGSELGQGHTISTVSIQLGADDFYGYALNNPLAFATAYQQSSLGALEAPILAALKTNYDTLLGGLTTALPTTNVLLVGYYNPFPALIPYAEAAVQADPTNLDAQLTLAIANSAPQVVAAVNQLIQGEAATFSALGYQVSYVDISGLPPSETYITTPPIDFSNPNDHPTAAGYAYIAGQIAAVPEPSGLVLLGLGGACLLRARRRRWVHR